MSAPHDGFENWPREQLVAWLAKADWNGIWSDEDSLANDMQPLTREEAVEQVRQWIAAEAEVDLGRTPTP